ncbi:hypothetical protein [Calycomorphotria hydatis]|uniref:hypothetical protein n=1 Tax=Calycomorphotria hydatis TaxID=2528027 RepID=UPI0011A552CA|nr:hypothetical protein [Calycomorphotria hydatis]
MKRVAETQHNSPTENANFGGPMKSGALQQFGLCVFSFAVVLCFAANVQAEDEWMFRRSYFSHDVPPEIASTLPTPQSRSAYRPAFVNPNVGISVSGGWRYNRVVIQSGQSRDTILLRRGFVRVQPY